MLRDRLKQGAGVNERMARERKRGELSPPVMRSPALESAERQQRQAQQAEKRTPRPLPSAQRKVAPRSTRISYAAEDTLVRPRGPRKSLPSHGNRLGTEKSHTGLTANWRRYSAPLPAMPTTPVQVISKEEQEKLSALEMRLPRVAGKIDAWLLIIVLMLLCIGLVMVYSASSFLAERNYGDASYFFQKQLIWALLGIVVMLVTMRIDYRQWRRISLPGMIIVLPLLVIVLVAGTSAYGASRWLGFGSFFSFLAYRWRCVDDRLGMPGPDVLAGDRPDNRRREPRAQPTLRIRVPPRPSVFDRKPVWRQVPGNQVRARPPHIRHTGPKPLGDLLQLGGQPVLEEGLALSPLAVLVPHRPPPVTVEPGRVHRDPVLQLDNRRPGPRQAPRERSTGLPPAAGGWYRPGNPPGRSSRLAAARMVARRVLRCAPSRWRVTA